MYLNENYLAIINLSITSLLNGIEPYFNYSFSVAVTLLLYLYY